ncbi:MAG: lysostaphin resistance A-like protein [Candidatus Entotheonellia bacterium]
MNRSDRELWLEVGVVLIVALLPMYSPAVDLVWPSHGVSSANESISLRDSLENIINDTSRSFLLLYLMWRSGEPWLRFGFTHSRRMKLDTAIVFGIVLMNYVVISEGLSLLLEPTHVEDNGGEPVALAGTALLIVQYVFFVVHICISAFYEELLMRGYLIPRFEQLLRSTWTSLFLTALLFGGFHVDQGMGGVLNATFAGLVYGGAFCWFRRLWPIAAAHIVYNLIVMLLPRVMGTPVT